MRVLDLELLRDPDVIAMSITLTVIAGPHTDRVFTFDGHDTFLVGRTRKNHFQLAAKDKNISRVHFMVEVNWPLCRLIDLKSRNHTYVNGKQVEQADLKDGDEIKAGQTVMRVSIADALATVASHAEARALATAPPTADKTRPGAPDSTPSAAERIEGYRIVSKLGEGGMGVVYLAVHEASQAKVALKTIIPARAASEDVVAMFLREARILRELSHPNIVAFRDMGHAAGRLFFAMDYVDGTDAAKLVKSAGPLPIPRAVALTCQLLEGLDYAHRRGYVHRDIKPANVLVATVNRQETVKVADFGLARVYQASRLSGLTVTGQVGGTAAFMAPDQVTSYREAKPSVDQYSAAATLYYLLTGRNVHDFTRQTPMHEQILTVLHNDPIPIQSRRADIPATLAQMIHRALSREPQDRFADARALQQALLPYDA